MSKARKICLGIMALFLAVCLGVGLVSCGSKDAEPTYGYGEEGTYYYSASDDTDYILTLRQGTYILTFGTEGYSGTYEYSEGALTLFEGEEEETWTGTMTDSGISLRYSGNTYLFLTYEYYTVSFVYGSETITTQSVLNGKAAQDPGDAEKDGYVFLGWYSDSTYTERYEFNTSITGNTTIYARFVEIEGTTEYTVTYDFGNGETLETETLNGKIYDLPEAEQAGYTFIGWWVSATDNADELTYKYDGETLYEDTTLYAVYASGSYIGASVKDGVLTWESSPAGTLNIYVADENGSVTYYSASSTSASQPLGAVSETGKYTIEITSGGVTETLTYVSNGLSRASGFTVISGSILMYNAVDNAEKYYISIDCGNPGHDHSLIDNGTSLYYDFSSCDMPATGITFTVYAYADGYYYSVSSYNYFLGLASTEVSVEGNEVSWTAVAYAMSYEVYIDGTLVATVSGTSYSLAEYGTGTYEIAVKPVTTGYYSELSETISFTKTTLASPVITGIDNYTITWTEVEGATGYIVSLNGKETTISSGDITSLILTDENYTEGLDSYEISVKAMAQDSANDSPYSDAITVTGTSVGSAVSYSNGTVTWQYSLSSSEYRITVNDGDELIVTGTNSSAVTLTKSGNNEIAIYFVNDDNEIYGTASITVYAYAVVFDARGGTAYIDGEAVDTIYVAKGDTITLPSAEHDTLVADFYGWYTLPDLTVDPDAETYGGDGVAFEDGTVFTGNSTIVLYACWLNRRLDVVLDTSLGAVYDEDGNVIESALIPINSRGFVLAIPEYDDAAYVFIGWYSGSNGTGTRYTDGNGNAVHIFDNSTTTTLYAYWLQLFEFEFVEYGDRDDVLSVSKGIAIDLVDEITIPETYKLDGVEYDVELIGNDAFADCPNLRVVNIPDTVKYIQITNNGYDAGTGAFALSGNIEDVNVFSTGEDPNFTREVVYYSSDGVLFWVNSVTENVELLYYPYARTAETYEIPETVWNENENAYEGNVEVPVIREVNAVAASVFAGHTELRYMVVPGFIESVGDSVFSGCTSLESVRFECSIDRIDKSMFSGCVSLTDVVLPETVTSIGADAFHGCSALEEIAFPGVLETIEEEAFRECCSLRAIELPYSLRTIGDSAFRDCSSLISVTVPEGVTEVGAYAFRGCESVVAVTLPSTLETIGNYAFYGCYALERIYYNPIDAEDTEDNNYIFYDAGQEGAGIAITIGPAVKRIPDYMFTSYVNEAHEPYVTSVVFASGSVCEEIGDYAFRHCSFVTIDLPSTLRSIGDRAFYECGNLVEITLGDNVEYLGSYAFYACSSLESVTLPQNLGSIEKWTFYNCSSLKGISIPGSVETVGEDAFYGCSSLAYAAMEDGLLYLEGDAFRSCTSLTSVDIPSTVKSIGTYCFYGCSALVNLTMREGLETISSDAFRLCTALVTVEIPSTVTTIGSDAFYGCSSLLSAVVPGGVRELGSYAFYTCTSLVSVTLCEGVESIGNYAFRGCTSLCEVNLPETLTTIGEWAFYDCRSIYSITIPSSVTEIKTYAFYYCTKLVEVCNLSSLNITTGTGNGHVGNYALNIYTPETGESRIAYDGDYAFYRGDDVCYFLGFAGSARNLVLPDGFDGNTYEIYQYAFYGNVDLETIEIPSGVAAVGTYAFYGCTSLRSVTMAGGVKSIGTYGFYNCTTLTSLTLSEGLETIGDYAFRGCSSLVSVTIPSTVKSMGNQAFRDCSSLSSVTIEEGVESIGTYAFANCTSLKSVTIPSSVTSLPDGSSSSSGYGVFGGCTSLEEVVFGSGLTSIGTYAFYQCTSLESVVIPGNVSSVGNYAFYGCKSLTSATLSEGVGTIGNNAFYGCSALYDVALPSTLSSIGSSAFYNCYSLFTITIPENVTSIGSNAFYNCYKLVEVYDKSESNLSSGSNSSNGYLANYALNVYTPTSGSSMLVYDGGCVFFCGDGESYLVAYTGTGVSVVLPDDLGGSAYAVYDYAFYDSTGIESVVISSGVTEIGTYAFYGCESLAQVTIRDGLASIGDYAFYGCISLAAVDMPSTVRSIGNYAFYGCELMKSAVMPEGVETIGQSAFAGCTNLGSVTIPSTVTSLGTNAFQNCYNLTEINFDSTEMSDLSQSNYVFSYAGRDTDGIALTIGSSVTRIPAYLFNPYNSASYAPNITSVTFAEDSVCEEIGQYAFRYVSALTSIDLPACVKTIGQYAFYNCTGLESAGLSGVTDIATYAFYGCTGIVAIALSEDLETIGTYAFYNCTSLLSLTVPAGVKTIGDDAFYGCSVLMSLTLSEGLETIGQYGFRNCTSLTSVTVPASVTTMNYAFYGCSGLREVILSDGLETIGNYAFYNCSSLPGIEIPASVTNIGNYAFYGCSSLAEIAIPSSVESVGNDAFYNCTSLESFTMGDGVESIGDYAFYGSGLEEIAIPSSVKTIGDYAFSKCTSLKTAELSEGLESLGASAFRDDTALESVNIPSTVSEIDSYTFRQCESLSSVTIEEGVTSFGTYAFAYCYSLPYIIIPDSVESMGTYTFRDDAEMRYVVIGSGMSSIGNNSFRDCTLLTDVFYHGTEEEWNAMSIGSSNNSALTSAARYYYSETEPDYTDGNDYWHYVNGEIVVWRKQ